MTKVCFSFNHFQNSDGIARSAIAMANSLSKIRDVEVTLRPVFKYDKSMCKLLNSKVKIKPVLGFYFNGLSKILKIIPDHFLHNWIFGKNEYDIEIGFQHGTATRAVVSSDNSDVKHLIWMHGYDEGLLMKNYYRKADKVICVSKYNASRLRCELSYDVPIEWCYNPIEEKKVIEFGKEAINIPQKSGMLFVTVGRQSEEKGYLRLIEVASKLKKKGYKFSIWFVGDGPQHITLVEKVKELNLENEIMFMGNQSNPHKFTSKADAFICSSFSEGYSTACTEAIMLGVPVITTEVSGAKEIIDNAECGLMVENSDEGLFLAMKSVMDNPQIIKSWKNTLKNTKQRFFAERRIKQLISVLGL